MVKSLMILSWMTYPLFVPSVLLAITEIPKYGPPEELPKMVLPINLLNKPVLGPMFDALLKLDDTAIPAESELPVTDDISMFT